MKITLNINCKSGVGRSCSKNFRQNTLGLIVSTDLIAAFDTVDHNKMKKKLKY